MKESSGYSIPRIKLLTLCLIHYLHQVLPNLELRWCWMASIPVKIKYLFSCSNKTHSWARIWSLEVLYRVHSQFFQILKKISDALRLIINTISTSSNGLAYFDEKKMSSVAVNKNIFLKRKHNQIIYYPSTAVKSRETYLCGLTRHAPSREPLWLIAYNKIASLISWGNTSSAKN